MRYIIDIESTNLLQNGLDYSSLPYVLKQDYKVWCVVLRNLDTKEVHSLVKEDITKANLKALLKDCTELIGHNIVAFDLPVLMLYGVLDYRVGYPDEISILFDKPILITDTLLWSKLLNADRLGGHSLDAWGKRLGNHKTHFTDWNNYSEEMLEYCKQDTAVNEDVYYKLLEEQGKHNWMRPYSMEVKLTDLTLRQELFGFDFNIELANKNIAELTNFMSDIALKVDPILPEKRLSKGDSSFYELPKIRFKKDGTVSSNLLKFIDKTKSILSDDVRSITFEGRIFPITTNEPLKEFTKATIEDIDVVKGYLLNIGWTPSEVKERDLVKNQDKTFKNKAQIIEAITRYVKQTEISLFKELRLELLDTTFDGLQKYLENKIEIKDSKPKPIYVPTTPKLTVGVEKEICPNLIALGQKAEFVKEVVHYYTYRHRKNSIAGGVLDEDGEPETGFISAVREDGRVPTPADTLGANTGRYRHKIVCNVPRVTSLYGEQMRSLFGSGKGLWQLGYDFASLEARIMGHYVMPYTDGTALAEALVAEKPNDIHSINARKLGIDRSSAKSFSYAAIYGAQPKKLSKMLGITQSQGQKLFNDYWDAVPALKELKQKVEAAWERSGKKTILGLDGRLLNTRSKHSLINVLFQSGGAIAAKWSAVRLAQAMEREDILGDPFQHNKAEPKVWWLIHMHDEQQMAVHPKLLNVKSFTSDEEAKAAMQDGCSAVGHGSKGAYIGFKTLPIECIAEGISSSVKELGLRVDLGFEWIPGLNWGQCH
jgi:DNA polymerase family A